MLDRLMSIKAVVNPVDLNALLYNPVRDRELRLQKIKHLAAGFGGFLAVTSLLAAAWIFGLRRTVALRTAEITEAKRRLNEELATRKDSEERISSSEKKYRQLFENALVGLFRTDAQLDTILEVNRRCAQMYGFSTPEEMIGRRTGEFFLDGNDQGEILARIRQAQSISGRVARVRRADDSEFFVEGTAWAGSEPGTIEGIHLDITASVNAQRDLQASEERLRKLVEYMPVMIHAHGEKGEYIFWNKECERVTGYTAQEMLDNPQAADKLYPDARYRELVKFMHEKNNDYRGWEVEIACADGSKRIISSSNASAEVPIPGWRAWETAVDITALKNAEQRIRKSEGKFRAIFEGSPIPLIIAAWEDGRILDANAAFLRNSGYEHNELVGRTALEIGLWVDLSERERIRLILERDRVVRGFECHFRFKTGEMKTFLVSVDLIEIEDSPSMLLGGIDITERKHVEQELRKLTSELEERVRERTFELELANRAKDEFLANMSHEIRTPLSGVYGMTEILLQREQPQPVREDLETIRNSAGTVIALLNDLLDLSRIERGRLVLNRRQFDLRGMLDNVVRLHKPLADEKGLTIEVLVAPGVPDHLLCDPDRIGQVLKNLLSNAVKFTEEGRIEMHVRMEASAEPQTFLEFSVSDTGIGIPPERHAKLFDSFTQIDPSYSKRFGGAGLGLAISKRLVELMGGRIAVESTLGVGSTFKFTVVCEKAEQDRDSATPGGIGLADLRPMNILLVEDNPVNRLFMERALRSAGHEVQAAADGFAALEKNAAHSFGLILMDIQMPGMDGVEATRKIRSGSHGRHDVPVVALTAYAMKGDREKFLAEGFDGYVTKPVDFGELAATINTACGLRYDSQDGRTTRPPSTP
jgi:PAS domain S-box-containing protein